eukprot:jgi/Mesen1/7955/ME000422S07108
MWYSDKPTVELEIFGQKLSIVQDNTTMHVGTTVWEASLVMAKWLEKNHKKDGEFSPLNLRGKRAIELGAGCGIADIPAVLPILKKNVKRNLASLNPKFRAAAGPAGVFPEVGKLKTGLLGAFDVVVVADVVYLEDIVEPLISTMRALVDERSVVLLGYSLRQAEAHALFWAALPRVFDVVAVPRAELHLEYAFEGVDLHILRLKKTDAADAAAAAAAAPADAPEAAAAAPTPTSAAADPR